MDDANSRKQEKENFFSVFMLLSYIALSLAVMGIFKITALDWQFWVIMLAYGACMAYVRRTIWVSA